VIRDHGVGQLTTAGLERTMRDLRANLSLISSDSPAHVPILAHMRQSTPSWPDVPVNRQPRGSRRHDSGIPPGQCPATLPGDIDRDKETP